VIKKKRNQKRRFPTYTRKPANQEVWDTAMDIAGGDPRLVDVLADGSVVVYNSVDRAARMRRREERISGTR